LAVELDHVILSVNDHQPIRRSISDNNTQEQTNQLK
jgi:hypothetical protein